MDEAERIENLDFEPKNDFDENLATKLKRSEEKIARLEAENEVLKKRILLKNHQIRRLKEQLGLSLSASEISDEVYYDV